MTGEVIDGRYRLVSMLGRGGMGVVWRAEHLALRSQVALKLLNPLICQSPEAIRRFQCEAQAAAGMRSANVVRIIDSGVAGNTPFIAMELLEGETLASRLKRLGSLTCYDTCRILAQVARGLGSAHAKGVIHRDLKPDNIFVAQETDGEVAKLLDFGIAKWFDMDAWKCGARTATGLLLGTPCYMSPEQASARSDLDYRTDIWSFGITAYECLLGTRPFEAPNLCALLNAICHESPPIPSARAPVPSGFDEWFARATARAAAERFHSAFEAAARLIAVCEPSAPVKLEADARRARVYDECLSIDERTPPNLLPVNGPGKRKRGRSRLVASALLILGIPIILASTTLTRPELTAQPSADDIGSSQIRSRDGSTTAREGFSTTVTPIDSPTSLAIASGASAFDALTHPGRLTSASPVASITRGDPRASTTRSILPSVAKDPKRPPVVIRRNPPGTDRSAENSAGF